MSKAEEQDLQFLFLKENWKEIIGSDGGFDEKEVRDLLKDPNQPMTKLKSFASIAIKEQDKAVSLARKEEREKFIPKTEKHGLATITSRHIPREVVEMVEARVRKKEQGLLEDALMYKEQETQLRVRLETAKEILEWMKSGEQNLISTNSGYEKDFKKRFLSKPQSDEEAGK